MLYFGLLSLKLEMQEMINCRFSLTECTYSICSDLNSQLRLLSRTTYSKNYRHVCCTELCCKYMLSKVDRQEMTALVPGAFK